MTISPRAVEAAIKAIRDLRKARKAALPFMPYGTSKPIMDKDLAETAITAYLAALAVDGVCLVPKEATLAMQNAAIPYVMRMHQTRDCYRAMIAAASGGAEVSVPVRIQRKRTKGWKMPPNTVSVGRPSIHGNKYRVGIDGDAAECVAKFRADWEWGLQHALGKLVLQQTLTKLRGKNLACWCPLDQPCHADVLLELANTPPAGTEV